MKASVLQSIFDICVSTPKVLSPFCTFFKQPTIPQIQFVTHSKEDTILLVFKIQESKKPSFQNKDADL